VCVVLQRIHKMTVEHNNMFRNINTAACFGIARALEHFKKRIYKLLGKTVTILLCWAVIFIVTYGQTYDNASKCVLVTSSLSR